MHRRRCGIRSSETSAPGAVAQDDERAMTILNLGSALPAQKRTESGLRNKELFRIGLFTLTSPRPAWNG
jgi:hypothetical protein